MALILLRHRAWVLEAGGIPCLNLTHLPPVDLSLHIDSAPGPTRNL
jgi:hypothetical protein